MKNKIEGRILWVETGLVYFLLTVIISGIFFKMVARNFLTSEVAIELSDKISAALPHLLLLLGMLGASVGISKSEVISIDLINRWMRAENRKWLQRVTYFFTSALCIIFLSLAYKSLEFGDIYWIWSGYIPALLLIIIKSIFKVL